MLVGDAGHQVNPTSGGGIISGMIGGMIAGQVAAEAMKANDLITPAGIPKALAETSRLAARSFLYYKRGDLRFFQRNAELHCRVRFETAGR